MFYNIDVAKFLFRRFLDKTIRKNILADTRNQESQEVMNNRKYYKSVNKEIIKTTHQNLWVTPEMQGV